MNDLHRIPLPNGETAPVTLRHSKRAKRVALRLVPGDGYFELVIPHGMPVSQAMAFAREKEDWLADRTARLARRKPFTDGMEFPYRGERLLIEITPRGLRRVEQIDGRLVVWPLRRDVDDLVTSWLKDRARERLTALAEEKSNALGRPFRRITLRDARTRWGSCSAGGNLNFSWRLIMAPDFVSDYLVAHEVGHLAHMNHSPAFWSVVVGLSKHTDEARGWLRRNGASLHLIGGGQPARRAARSCQAL